MNPTEKLAKALYRVQNSTRFTATEIIRCRGGFRVNVVNSGRNGPPVMTVRINGTST